MSFRCFKKSYSIQNPFFLSIIRMFDMLLGVFSSSSFVNIPTPRRILLSNIAHLGDVVLTTSVLPILREKFPELKIGILTGSWSKHIIEFHPLIDFVHVVDHWKLNRSPLSKFKKLKRYWGTRKQALVEIKEVGYDIAIDFYHCFPNSALLLFQTKIPVRIGHTYAGFSPFLTHSVDWEGAQQKSIVAYHLKLCQFLLQEPTFCESTLRPSLPSTSSKSWKEKVPDQFLEKGFIVIHTGAGIPLKEWPEENWRLVVKELSLAGYFLVLLGKGDQEYQRISRIIEGISRAINLCNNASWQEMTSLIENAKLFIGLDSVAGHIASAFNIPSLTIFCGINDPNLWAPIHSKKTVLFQAFPCLPCNKKEGCRTMKCIRTITPQQVLKEVDLLLLAKH